MCHIINKYGKMLIVGILVLVSASCKVLKMPETNADENLFRDLNISDSTNIAYVPWREMFTDPNLQNLIQTTIESNPDLKIAIARVRKAEAAFRQSKAEFFPSLNAGFNTSYQSEAGDFGIPELYQLFGSTSWEADIWGKLRSSKRAALASLMASEAFHRAVITDLVASVALNYYTLLALDAQLAITEQTVGKRIRNVEVMELMKDNDVITGADLVLSQANRYSAEVIIPDLRQRIYETENTLSLLMGQAPRPIKRGSLDEQELSADLKTGVPAQLLANRPDVLEAEYRLRFFFESTKVARRNFYPSLTITSRGGLTETSLDALFSAPVVFWSVTGSLLQPIFNYGLNLQRLRSAHADLEESQASFRRIVLNAGAEVTNAMRSYESATDKIFIRARQIEYLEKAVEYTTELLKYTSNTSYIDVLTSEVNLLSAQLASVNDKLEQLQSIVTLYQSLGGGWN
jgi:NodT family efflux transporter outer membrane factor (OMF) lipoprotein